MGIFSFLFTSSVQTALERGAEIVDIRSAAEFDNGHVPGAHNIPVDRLSINLPRVKNMKHVIICGNGDARNRQAVTYLRQHGMESIDGGSWQSVYRRWKRL